MPEVTRNALSLQSFTSPFESSTPVNFQDSRQYSHTFYSTSRSNENVPSAYCPASLAPHHALRPPNLSTYGYNPFFEVDTSEALLQQPETNFHPQQIRLHPVPISPGIPHHPRETTPAPPRISTRDHLPAANHLRPLHIEPYRRVHNLRRPIRLLRSICSRPFSRLGLEFRKRCRYRGSLAGCADSQRERADWVHLFLSLFQRGLSAFGLGYWQGNDEYCGHKKWLGCRGTERL